VKTGKLPWDKVASLLSRLPVDDIDLVMGPSQGEDAAVIRVRDGFLVVHADPITTGVKHAGYLAVHVAANDIAVRGVKPRWFLPVILFPEAFSEVEIDEFFSDIGKALREIGGVVVGGHTEVTPGINRPIISMTAAGFTTSRIILTRDARPGDVLYVVGRVGGEGAGIIAWDFLEVLLERNIEAWIIEEARKYMYQISIVNTALGIRDYVSAMHDATEGGVLQALRELAVASGGRAVIDVDKLKIDEPVEAITKAVNLDPLRILSSGCIVASVPPSSVGGFEKAVEELRVQYSRVGYMERGSGEVVLKKGSVVLDVVDRDIVDEIYKLWI
jgi:hydrogenase maturation factor